MSSRLPWLRRRVSPAAGVFVPDPIWELAPAGIQQTGAGNPITSWDPTAGGPSVVPDAPTFGAPTYDTSGPVPGVKFTQANGEALFGDDDLTTVASEWSFVFTHSPLYSSRATAAERSYILEFFDTDQLRQLEPHLGNFAFYGQSPPYAHLGQYQGNANDWYRYMTPRGNLVHAIHGPQVTAFSVSATRQIFGAQGLILASTPYALGTRRGVGIVLGAAGNVVSAASDTFYDGTMFRIRAWDRALSSAQLRAAMNAAIALDSIPTLSYVHPLHIDTSHTLFLERGRALPATGTLTSWTDEAQATVWTPTFGAGTEPTNTAGEPTFDGTDDGITSGSNLTKFVTASAHSGYVMITPNVIAGNSATPGNNDRVLFTSLAVTLLLTLRNNGGTTTCYVGHSNSAFAQCSIPAAGTPVLIMWVYDGVNMNIYTYWNGGSATASAAVANLADLSRVLAIGRNSATSHPFNGDVHAVYVTNEAWPDSIRAQVLTTAQARYSDLLS